MVMTTAICRPWGQLNWVLERSPDRNWAFFGCLGTEERPLTAWLEMQSRGMLDATKLLRVADASSPRYAADTADRLAATWRDYTGSGGRAGDVNDFQLHAAYSEIVSVIDDYIEHSGPNILLDITSLPKRFFFPILRRMLRADFSDVQNILVTYTVPGKYPPGKLADNFDAWEHLPLFGGDYTAVPAKMLVVGVGFNAMGLQNQVDHADPGRPIRLLLPFPAQPSRFRRSWELARRLQRHRPEIFSIYRTDPHDPSGAFDRIVTLTNNGAERADFAPFGPKPVSLAICIFATLTESQVFYTQPSVYHPDYSIGVSRIDGIPETYAYYLRIDGRDIFRL